MKYFGYKILHAILRLFVYIKRGVVWGWKKIWGAMQHVFVFYDKTIGFYLYKGFYSVKKLLQKHKIPLDRRFFDVLARRGTLQMLLFIVVLAIVYPHSKLYTQDISHVPGMQSVLYQLVGPGDQFFDDELVIVESAGIDQRLQIEQPTWREGAVAGDAPSAGTDMVQQVQDIAAISVGGSALTKPTILPGSTLPAEPTDTTAGSTSSGKRKEVSNYTVQSGDSPGSIANKFDISLQTLLAANGLSSRSVIRPGQTLKILPGTGVIHKVVRGDTVGKIARKYDAETNKIVEANKLQRDGSDIVIGEELFIPEGKIVQATRITGITTRPSAISSITPPPPSASTVAGSGYLWPTAVRRITQYYGWRHTGLDIAGPIGTPLYASRAGKVIKSQCGWNGGYGCYIIVDHGGGVQTLYAHASQLYVSVGDAVSQGQTIAVMGSTGRSTGPHIHYEVRVNGRRQNPLQYIR